MRLLLLCLLFSCGVLVAQTTILEEDFDHPNFPPPGWTSSGGGGPFGAAWTGSSTGSDGNPSALGSTGFAQTFDVYLYSSDFSLSAGTTYTLEFTVASNFPTNLEISYRDSPDQTSTKVTLENYVQETFGGTNSGFETRFIEFTPTGGGTNYLEFHFYGNDSDPAGSVRIDEIQLYESPECPKPWQVMGISDSPTSVQLSWTERGTATSWTIKYNANSNFDPETEGTALTVSSNPATITMLGGITEYYFYVRANCTGPTATSAYSPDEAVITTQCPPVLDPYFEGAESNSVLLDCWTLLDADNNFEAEWYSGEGFLPARTGSRSFNFENYADANSSMHNDYLISPQFFLEGNEFLEFYYQVDQGVTFEVLLSDQGTNPADFTTVLIAESTYSTTNPNYVRRTIDLSDYSGGIWVAWHVTASSTNGSPEEDPPILVIDDISLLGPPTNDDCADAEAISNDISYSSVTAAGSSPTVATSCGGNADDDVWYSLTTTSADQLTITLEDDASATLVLQILTGDCNSLSSVFCGGEGTNTFTPLANTTYYIRIYDSAANIGRLPAETDSRELDGFTLTVSGATLLPAELLDFSGRATEGGNELSWTTASESNTDYFALERSTDGLTWTLLDRQTAAGTSSGRLSYRAFDAHPADLSYYRLRTVDLDNSSQLSRTISVERTRQKKLKILPNPTPGDVRISLQVESSGEYRVRLRNLAGTLLEEQIWNTVPGTNLLELPLDAHPAGCYFIQVSGTGTDLLERIVKM